MPSRAGPTKISAHMLKAMSRIPRLPSPVAGARKAEVTSRYHSPAATPCGGPPNPYEAYPSISRLVTTLGRTQVSRKIATLIPTSAQVTTAPAAARPPKASRGWRVSRAAWPMHSTHCWPTDAERMQSGQAGRPQRTHET